MSETLSVAYRIAAGETGLNQQNVPVAIACGGCPDCRRRGRPPYADPATSSRFTWPARVGVGPRLASLLNGSTVLSLFETEIDPLQRRRAAAWMFEQGIQCLIAPEDVLSDFRVMVDPVRHGPVFVSSTFLPFEMPRVPTLFIDPDPRDAFGRAVRHSEYATDTTEPYLFLLPMAARDPNGRVLADVMPGQRFTLSQLDTMEVL